jgi:Zn-finger nucleic acid-binding protein
MPQMLCPRCSTALNNAPTLTFHICPRCAGVFVPLDAAAQVKQGPDAQHRAALQNADLNANTIARTQWVAPCPVCKAHMQRDVYGKQLQIDRCAEHGLWFDKGELSRLRDALQKGLTRNAAPTPASPAASASSAMAQARVPIDATVQDKINALARNEGLSMKQGQLASQLAVDDGIADVLDVMRRHRRHHHHSLLEDLLGFLMR